MRSEMSKRSCLVGLIASLAIAAGLWAAVHHFPGLISRWSEPEAHAAAAAETVLRDRGSWQDGSEERVTRRAEGWFVFVVFPGNLAGGHCGVLLDPEYRLIRIDPGR